MVGRYRTSDPDYYSRTLVGAIKTMILVSERADYLTVFRVHMRPKMSADKVGVIRTHNGQWRMEFTGTSYYWDAYLDGSEKRQILGLLDKLNGTDYRTKNASAAKRWWDDITGLTDEARERYGIGPKR